MRVVILVGAGSGVPKIPVRWESEHDVTVVSLPSRLARLRGRRGPVVVDASRWMLPLWAGLSPRARTSLRSADLVVAADTTAQPLAWALARSGRIGVATIDGAAAWLGPETPA